MMKQTMTLKLDELLDKMRHMEEGEEIGLCGDEKGNGCYGIRRIPGGMFDNGMCWIADYYGGGATAAFSETEDDFMSYPDLLQSSVACWLDEHDLLNRGNTVFVETRDWTEPETRWEFKETVIPPKNKLVCVDFMMTRSYRTYISVPAQASNGDIIERTKAALIDCDKETFDKTVICTDNGIWPDDFVDCTVGDFFEPTDLPTGTLSK